MAENDFFVSEVSSDLRQERLKNLWQRFRWAFLGLFLVIIALVGYNEFRSSKSADDGEAQYSALQSALDGQADVAALAAYPSELSQMEEARVLLDEGKTDEAKAIYQSIANNGKYTSTAREFAQLQLVGLDPATSTELLNNPDAKFSSEASLIEVNTLLEEGKTDEAIAVLQKRMDSGISQSEKDFTQNLIMALGGEVPGADEEADATASDATGEQVTSEPNADAATGEQKPATDKTNEAK